MEAHLVATQRNPRYRLSSVVEHYRIRQSNPYQQIDVVGGRPNRSLSQAREAWPSHNGVARGGHSQANRKRWLELTFASISF